MAEVLVKGSQVTSSFSDAKVTAAFYYETTETATQYTIKARAGYYVNSIGHYDPGDTEDISISLTNKSSYSFSGEVSFRSSGFFERISQKSVTYRSF